MKAKLTGHCIEAALRQHCTEAAGVLQEVCLHAVSGGGRTRANLLLQAAECEDGRPIQAACALEMMHAATLLQDDIFDRSARRRGRRTAHLLFGEAQAVLASDWLLLRSLELAAEVDVAFFQQLACAARKMATTVAKELHPPVVAERLAARSYIDEIGQGKTASLFAVALYGAALLHPGFGRLHAPVWASVANRIGCAYQLLDDCLDVYAPEGCLSKSTGVDLEQGRLTLPLLTALERLQGSGENISLDRLRKARLTETETALMEVAVADSAVRGCLEQEAKRHIRDIRESARLAGIPSSALLAALGDLEAKAALCFGAEPFLAPAIHDTVCAL